jgi:hypothetical protein
MYILNILTQYISNTYLTLVLYIGKKSNMYFMKVWEWCYFIIVHGICWAINFVNFHVNFHGCRKWFRIDHFLTFSYRNLKIYGSIKKIPIFIVVASNLISKTIMNGAFIIIISNLWSKIVFSCRHWWTNNFLMLNTINWLLKWWVLLLVMKCKF